MLSASTNPLFNHPTQALQARSRSKEKRPGISYEDQGIGYGCTIYQDHLVLLGTTRQEAERGESIVCAYNLKEKRPKGVERISIPISSCTACFYPGFAGIIFYGTVEGEGGRRRGNPSPSQRCSTASIKIQESGRDQLIMTFQMDTPGPGSALSVCCMMEGALCVYDPSTENANFGSLQSMDDTSGKGWTSFHANTNDLSSKSLKRICFNIIGLHEPSRHAVFVDDALYIFAANVDFPSQTVETGESVIEDIYTLNLKKGGTWERISPSGRVPGVMRNVSLAEANGMIYVFGSSKGRSVLWVYNINDKEWNQVRDINNLTARPDQKAVIYEGKLLIVEWGYSRDSVQIQYLSLTNLDFANLDFTVPSMNENSLCRDEAEKFFEDAKNLYNTKIFSDVIFEIEGEEIPAHKATLASRSNYFMKMFTSGMSESHSAKISIPNMKSHIFKAMLQYIYCNEVELNEKLALDLIPTVDEFVMKGLKGLCEKYLCEKLRKDNAVDILIVAERHEIQDLKKSCFKFILNNLDNLHENEEINKLSKSLLVELLKLCNSEKKDKPSENSQTQYAFPKNNNNMNNNIWNNNNNNNNFNSWNNNNNNQGMNRMNI